MLDHLLYDFINNCQLYECGRGRGRWLVNSRLLEELRKKWAYKRLTVSLGHPSQPEEEENYHKEGKKGKDNESGEVNGWKSS